MFIAVMMIVSLLHMVQSHLTITVPSTANGNRGYNSGTTTQEVGRSKCSDDTNRPTRLKIYNSTGLVPVTFSGIVEDHRADHKEVNSLIFILLGSAPTGIFSH